MKWILLALLIIATLIGGGLWYYYGDIHGEPTATVAFVEAYGEYEEVATQVEKLINAPAAGGNSARQALLSLLSSILTGEQTPEEREQSARAAFAELEQLRREVDAAQAAQASIYSRLDALSVAAQGFRAKRYVDEAQGIVVLSRQRVELGSQITSILAETNEHTYAIITRILDEKGNLSQAHIVDINAATDAAEVRFETLNTRYQELAAKRDEASARFNALVRTAL